MTVGRRPFSRQLRARQSGDWRSRGTGRLLFSGQLRSPQRLIGIGSGGMLSGPPETSHWLPLVTVQPLILTSGRIRLDAGWSGRQTVRGERLAGHGGVSVVFLRW